MPHKEWVVEYTEPFGRWLDALAASERSRIDAHVRNLQRLGPNLPFPLSSGLHSSRHSHMRELRVQSKGKPYRVIYAFDPRRVAILLIGGLKTTEKRFYDRMIPLADALYDEHLASLEEDGDGP